MWELDEVVVFSSFDFYIREILHGMYCAKSSLVNLTFG